MARLSYAQADANQMIDELREPQPFPLTRMILAMEQQSTLPKDVTHVTMVAAYQSEADFRSDFLLETSSDVMKQASLGLLIGHKFAVPVDVNPEKALADAIELASDDKFREKRRDLYEWQEDAIEHGLTSENAMKELDQMIEEYNHAVERGKRNLIYRFAFVVGGIAVGLAGAALGNPLTTTAAVLSVVQFATLDRKSVIDAGKSGPAAMFHDVRKVLG